MPNIDIEKSISTYMTIDPLFRIHSRLYKIYSLNLMHIRKSIEISKTNISFYGLAFAGFIGIIIYLFQLLGWSPKAIPVGITIILAIYPAYLYIKSLVSVIYAEKELDRLLKEVPAEEIEDWTSYNLDLIAAHGTRLKIVEEILMAAEDQLRKDQNDTKAKNISESYKIIKEYLLEQLDRIEKENEEAKANKTRLEHDYNKIRLWLQNAWRGISK